MQWSGIHNSLNLLPLNRTASIKPCLMFWVSHKLRSYQAPVQTSAYPVQFCLFRQVVKLDGLVREGMVRSKGLGLCHMDSLHCQDWVGLILGPDGIWRRFSGKVEYSWHLYGLLSLTCSTHLPSYIYLLSSRPPWSPHCRWSHAGRAFSRDIPKSD